MRLHTLHVKNGACNIIEHERRKSLLDIYLLAEAEQAEEQGAGALVEEDYAPTDSTGGYVYTATNPITYWKAQLKGSAYRTIITHPDKDHLQGISKFAAEVGTTVLWMPTEYKHTLPSGDDGDFINRVIAGKEAGTEFVEPHREDNCQYYGTAQPQWDQIKILHPAKSHPSKSSNEGSYLLKINYGTSSVIIGGDTEPTTFDWLYDKYPDELKCTVFVAPHHGRQTGWPGKEVLQYMNPLMVLVPRGKIPPKECALQNYKAALGNARVLTTSFAGNIRIDLSLMDDIQSIECDRQYVNKLLPDRLKNARILRKSTKQ